MKESEKRIKMVLYFLEKDVKIPAQKWDIIANNLYFIGRSKKESDISLDIKLLSRRHAELYYYNNNKILIRDLGSRNGTYLNKIRIEPLKDIFFTVNDILSFGNIENEIYFYELNDENKEKFSELENSDKIKKCNYIDENKTIKKSYSNAYSYKNSKSKHYSNKSRSKSRNERSRSRESFIEQSRNYSKGYNISPRINYLTENQKYDYYNRKNDNKNISERRSNGNSLEKYKLYESTSRIYENEEDYPKRLFTEEKERNSLLRRSQRSREYEDEDFEKNGMFLNIYKDKYEDNNNFEKYGFIKCYVSGYMKLNIRK